jgi:hypothetical protein
MVAIVLLITLLLCSCLAHLKETYDEKLSIYQLPNGYAMANFTFSFDIQTSNNKVDKMPIQIYQLIKSNEGIEEVKLDLVQGRWQENVMKKVTSFSNRQFSLPEFSYAEPGLAIQIRGKELT